MRLYFFKCLLILSLLSTRAMAQQQEPRITGRFEKLLLPEFFKQLEAQAPVTFYFDISKLDSVYVDLNLNNEPLSAVLEKALDKTGLQFSITGDGQVFITRGLRLVTKLPSNLFKSGESVAATGNSVDSVAADFDLAEKKARTVTSENKLYEIGAKTNAARGPAILTGTVRNAKTGEPLVNASVFIDSRYYTTTDGYGHYSLNVPAGNYTLNILAVGMRDTRLQLAVFSDGKLDVDVAETITTLKEVIISSRKTLNITNVNMGVARLNIETIKKVPSVFGEADVLRVITSLPGVKTVGEASTGFNVRGGSADQNLILYNESTIYNPSHFFGIFSAFNPEVVNEIELYKSSIPAKYGGRLASVLEINSREGNKKKITGSAGLGLVTSRIHLEGPIAKDRTSFIFGGRTTYANWLMNLLPNEYKNSSANFQDLNLGISHQIDSTNNLYFSGYYSNDRFSLNTDTVYGYNNYNFSVKWKRNFTRRLTGEVVAGVDRYQYSVNSDQNPVNAFTMKFSIQQLYARMNFVYYRSQQHGFDFGVSTMRYKLSPGSYEPKGSQSLVTPDIIEDEQAQESALYLTHRFNPSNKFSVNTGLRYSMFNYLGPNSVNYYAPGQPVNDDNKTETVDYGKGKIINTYSGPEFRFSVRYSVTASFSVKAGFNSQRQYIHMLSNTTAIAPTDIWKLSDPNIRPQRGNQFSLGFYKNLKSNTIETSLEVYYKTIRDYLDYKPGATLLLNPDIETDVINTRGKAYGLEFLIKKPGGKLNGWISYTYSRILLRSDDPDLGVLVNNGDFYPANYDKPHDITLTGNFRITHRFSISLNSTYSTGRPITLPIGRYYYAGSQRVLYSDRNAYRIPDYFRTDFSINIDGNHKVNQKTHGSWTIGLYNLLGRRNPYSVYFVSEDGLINGYKLSIFGSVIPFINYNIRF
ncbi:MAG: TonB-dependent receptor domain-containing protein [Chitinophagaceae bacterium]